MNLVAMKMLVGDRLKYVSLVAGLTFAALLITQQGSIFAGYALRTGAWIRDTHVADLWVMDDQVEHTEDIKPLLETALYRVRGIDGVMWAVPMSKNYFNAILPDGTRTNVRVIGLDDATLTGGPPVMVEGRMEDLRQDKAVLMNADAKIMLTRFSDGKRALRIGDRISLNDNEAVIVGSYRSTPEFFWEPVFYTTYGRAKYLYKDRRKPLNFVLVKVQPGQAISQVARRIESATGYKALTNEEFEKQTMQWILDKTGILINFGITIALGFLIGVLAAGQTLYTFVLDNLKHFAALKAMGAGNWMIIRMVFLQVATVGTIGYGLGIGVASITGVLFLKAGLAFQMPWEIPVVGLISLIFCCFIAAVISLVRVLRLDPAVVFKG
jgi:putative ABC transport system permease protein